ncbi:hypothetical protein [Desulfobaculum sp.]
MSTMTPHDVADIVVGVVKARTLSRFLAIHGAALPSDVSSTLWDIVDALTPAEIALERAISLPGELADFDALREAADRIETDEQMQELAEELESNPPRALLREQAGCEEHHMRKEEPTACA